MITQLLKELQDTWGYTMEELNDIEEKMKEFGNACFWEGYAERGEEASNCTPLSFYAKKSDMDGYE